MKIALVSDTYWPRINGVTVSLEIFWKQLGRNGHDAHIWCSDYPGTVDEPRVHRLPSHALWFSPEDRLVNSSQRRRFEREMDAFAPDIIHIQTEFGIARFAFPYARRRGIPVVMTCHTYFEPYIQYYFPMVPSFLVPFLAKHITRFLYKDAVTIITPTASMREVLKSYGLQADIHVIPTGIEVEAQAQSTSSEAAPTTLAPELGRQLDELSGRRLLLSVGRIGQEKNLDFLLDVMDGVRARVPEATLLIAGSGPYLEAFRRKIEHRGLSGVVRCLGYVERAQLQALYRAAEVFVFASVTETQGLVTIEAMMCHTPVVAIGKMGTREVMQGDNGGYMVDDDVEEFTTRVVQLLSDAELRQAKREQAWTYAQNWTAAAMTLRLQNLYDELVRQS